MIFDFKKFSAKNALVDDQGTIVTYSELDSICQSVSSKIQTPSKNLCIVFCKNSIGSILSYLSVYLSGNTCLLINSSVNKEFALKVVNAYKPAYLFLPKEQLYPVEEFGSDASPVEVGSSDYVFFKSRFTQDYKVFKELALLLTTSGSTGSQKLVRQSYTNIESNTESIAGYLQISSDDKAITVLPMHYTFGLSVINTHLYSGATVLVTDKSLMQKEFWQFLKNSQATSFSGVPYTYEMLKVLRFTKMDLPYLKVLTQAGGHLSKELQEFFTQYASDAGKKFYVMYGQCEATARMSYLSPEDAPAHLGSIGKALSCGEFKLRKLNHTDDKTEEFITESNAVGELIYSGPNVTLGYASCRQDLCKGDNNQGVLSTGDLAYHDENGFFYITGRKNRVLKIYGNRVNLDELDSIIKSEYPELSFATCGREDHLTIFVEGDHAPDEQGQHQIIDYLSNKVGLNKKAFHIKLIDKLPRNESGKILFKLLDNN